MRRFSTLAAALAALGVTGATAKKDSFTRTEHLEQAFFFDWSTSGFGSSAVAQCDSLNLTWSRGDAKGPNPQAPYYLSVYTSSFVVPLFIPAGSNQELRWPVPFIPGTQFQICMFDKNGNSGGCQRQVTVFPAKVDNPICTNLTYPQSAMDVQGGVATGPISQYGWPQQCTDIQLTPPKNGTPPFTMTVAPSLHPPYNITSNSMDSINWTVALSWGSPFWVSLIDSEGHGWANGPMHAGGGGTTACLSNALPDEGTSPYAAVGAGVGGLTVGLLAGLLGAWWVGRNSRKRRANVSGTYIGHSADDVSGLGIYDPVPTGTTMAGTVNSMGGLHKHGNQYHVEPWTPPSLGQSAPQLPPIAGNHPTTPYHDSPNTPGMLGASHVGPQPHSPPSSQYNMSSPTFGEGMQASASGPSSGHGPNSGTDHAFSASGSGSRTEAEEQRASSHVYVVHHDGGRAPVTVYTADGTEVVELPPNYDNAGRPRPVLPMIQDEERRALVQQPRQQQEILPPALQQRRAPGGIRKTRVDNSTSSDFSRS